MALRRRSSVNERDTPSRSRRDAAQNKGEKKRPVSQLREAMAEADDGDEECESSDAADDESACAADSSTSSRRATRQINGAPLTKEKGPSTMSQRKASATAIRSRDKKGNSGRRKGTLEACLSKRHTNKVVKEEPTAKQRDHKRSGPAHLMRRLDRDGRTRSVKVVTQVDDLANLFDRAGAPATKTSKASVIANVSDDIGRLASHDLIRESERCDIVSKIVSVVASSNRSCLDDEKLEQVDYRLVFLQSSVPMAVSALEGKILACNERFVAAVGAQSEKELISRSIFDLAVPASLQHLFSCIASLLRSEKTAPCGEVVNAIHATPSTMSIVYIKPSSLVVSLVKGLPPVSTKLTAAESAMPSFEHDLAVVETAKQSVSPVPPLVPPSSPQVDEPTGLERRIIG